MSKSLVTVTILFLAIFCAAGGSVSLTDAAARRIPWDCSNWAAYAHEDRTTAILETLAENRGRTLYCGIDQSDTFTKAETWAAGRDRNERDDTIYWGERGNFRGFIAAQEGWLTEGESGITGQSIASIFEFPREQRGRRSWKTKRLRVPASNTRPIHSAYAENSRPFASANSCAKQNHEISARTTAMACFQSTHATQGGRPAGWANDVADASWQRLADDAATRYCEEQGFPRATRVAATRADSSYPTATDGNGNAEGWEFYDRNPTSGGQQISYKARKVNTWSAVCVKRVRGPRR